MPALLTKVVEALALPALSKCGLQGGGEGSEALAVGDIEAQSDRTAPERFDLTHDALRLLRIGEVGQDDVAAARGEFQSRVLAEAAARAGCKGDGDGGGHVVALVSLMI